MLPHHLFFFFFFFNDTATTEIYTLSLHDALPICGVIDGAPGFPYQIAAWHHGNGVAIASVMPGSNLVRSEEHTSELQSLRHLVCRLLLEKKKSQQCCASRRFP